jgi:hypothetical protein
MFYTVCFLRSRAVNRKWLDLWLLGDQVENSTQSAFSAGTFAPMAITSLRLGGAFSSEAFTSSSCHEFPKPEGLGIEVDRQS